MKPRFEIDSDRFDSALRSFQAHSKRNAVDNAKSQAKLLVVDAAGVTPPNKKFKWNKKGGEQTVKNDLAKLFKASRSKSAATDLARIHRAARDRRGRVPKGVTKVKAANLVAYRKEMLARVGKMAAGWKTAASKLGAKLPVWITRHDTSGHASITVKGNGVEIIIANKAVYSGQKNWVQRGLDAAVRKRYWAMIKRVNFLQAQSARKAGLQVK
jgi:hypothetical protein